MPPATSTSLTNSSGATVAGGGAMLDPIHSFRTSLLENMRDGAIFLDNHCQILQWNRGMETLTGIGKTVVGSILTPSLLQLRTPDHDSVQDHESPFPGWIRERKAALGSYVVGGLSGRQCDVDMVFHPVESADGKMLGGLLLLHDKSLQNDLQKQLNALQTIATIDPLTQVGNRAEFERLLDEYVRTHKQVGLKCSLIIGDLDYFKKINDTWGHHIGDHALVAFAQLLRHHVRGRDFVARYGGEEFVILCANCDETAAAKRGDQIREELASIAQPMMQGQRMHASFGVTELRDDDDPTSLFVRADKALLWAKQTGRNRVVISGQEPNEPIDEKEDETDDEPRNERTISGATWPEHSRPPVYCIELAAPDLLPIFVEKLKAWIEEANCRLEYITSSLLQVSLTQVHPDNPKISGQLLVDIDLTQIQAIERPTNLPDGTRVVFRVSVFGKPSLWKKAVDFDQLAVPAINRLRKIVGLYEDKYLLKWPERKKDSRRY